MKYDTFAGGKMDVKESEGCWRDEFWEWATNKVFKIFYLFLACIFNISCVFIGMNFISLCFRARQDRLRRDLMEAAKEPVTLPQR